MSDDQQRKASIEDQFRNCLEGADEKGLDLLEDHRYKDEGKTGTTMFGRPGFAALRAQYRQKNPPFRMITIDDTSRMGRNEADVYKVLDELEFYGIHIYFASDGLDSRNPWFREAFSQKARADAQWSKTHGKRVRRGRIGQFERGFNPGWGCYGYRNVREVSADKDARGRAATTGFREEIDPEEAKIVVLIFMLYAEGKSPRQIMVRLNAEGVPPPRKIGRKTKLCTWVRSAINYILHNQRYLGILVYGRLTRVRNPETGKMVQRVHPESEWRKKEHLELRIVQPELWERVVAERARKKKAGNASIGGMNRTDNSRKYFLSSKLVCGCGETYKLRAHGRYVCSGYDARNSCPNCATFKREEIEHALISALCDRLRSPDLRESLVQSLLGYLKSEKANQEGKGEMTNARMAQLEADRKAVESSQANFLEAIRVGGRDLRSLVDSLASTEEQIARLDKMISALGRPAEVKEIRLDEVRKFVDGSANDFEMLLLGSAEMLKVEFQRRIEPALEVTPTETAKGRVFRVAGDVRLFSPEVNGALLYSQVNPFVQQSTIHVDFEIPLYVTQITQHKAA
jgi:DNA invertase Pin-like site-specific DNA recombinase